MIIPIKLEKRTEGEREAYAEGYAAGKRNAVKHGRWVDEVYTAGVLEMYGHKCSVCGAITPVNVDRYRYCPMCGAIMDGKSKCVECKGGYCEDECGARMDEVEE